MDNQAKYKFAYALTSVASTGLSFVQDSLTSMMNDATDLSRLRSFYILLSYNFELLLKSRIVMTENFANKQAMNSRLIELGHDIQTIANTLGNSTLAEIGIAKVENGLGQYKITTTDNKNILIENFTRIRYDFLDNIMRTVGSREHERIKEYVDILFSILIKIKRKMREQSRCRREQAAPFYNVLLKTARLCARTGWVG
ncbi:MAG TPA: hypothetical protein VI483_03775, partial [Candidatus Paceibacterota bacterium]